MELDEPTRKFLKSNDHCRFATIGEGNGFPHCVPVGYFYNDNLLYMPTNSESTKAKNALAEPKSCVIVDTYENGAGRSVMLQGFAHVAIGKEFSRLKPVVESISGWHLDKWELGRPPRSKVDAIIEFTPRRVAIIGDL